MLQPGRSGNDTTGGTRTTWRVGQAADRTQIGSTRTGIGRGNLLSASGGKRAFTGAEIALAAILVAAGTARVRKDRLSERELSEDGIITGQTILLDGSVLNEYHRPGDAVSLKGKEYSWNRAGSSGIGSDDCPDKEKPGGIVYGVLRRPSHIVAATDTLTGIADAIYGDSNLGWLIADLNAGNIKDTIIDGKRVVELKSRQKIDLPVWQDIVAFYENSPEGATPDNLITIVSETQIDREVIDDSLGIAVGASSRSQDPFHRNLASASVAASVQMAAEAQDAGENEPTIGSILNAGKAIHAFSGRFPGPPPTPGWVRLPQKMSV